MHIEWNKVTWYSKLIALILFCGVFVFGIYVGVQIQALKDANSLIFKNSNSVSQTSNAQTCTKLPQEKIISDIGVDASKYELGPGAGYSPDNCHYAINIYFNDKFPLSNAAQLTDSFVGAWLVDTKTNSAQSITTISDYNANFKDWISNSQLELMPNNNDTTSVYDITLHSIISTTIENLTFQFNMNDDAKVTVTPKDITDAACIVSRSSVQELFDYSYACIQNNDITMSVAGYKTFVVHYSSPNVIIVNEMRFNVSPTTATVIHL